MNNTETPAEALRKGDRVLHNGDTLTVRSARPYITTVVVRWFESKTPTTYAKGQRAEVVR